MKTKTYHSETLKPGFYYPIDINLNMLRCYYLSGSKKGNKWIDLAYFEEGETVFLNSPEWMSLIWTCIPTSEELNEMEYSKTNPTTWNLK